VVALGALGSAMVTVKDDPEVAGAVASGPPSPLTTSTAAARSPTSTTVPTTTMTVIARRSAVASSRLKRAQAIADTSSFDWRAAGVTIRVGHHPAACCHWGVYDYGDNTVWIGSGAFASRARLRYVVFHEVAHAWQWASGKLSELAADMAPWGSRGFAALDHSADCVAAIWGARVSHYWSCPPAARHLVSRRLSGDWR
jgi:hypothetical protein